LSENAGADVTRLRQIGEAAWSIKWHDSLASNGEHTQNWLWTGNNETSTEKLRSLGEEATTIYTGLMQKLQRREDRNNFIAGGRLVVEVADPTPITGTIAGAELIAEGHPLLGTAVLGLSWIPVIGSKVAQGAKALRTPGKEVAVATKEVANAEATLAREGAAVGKNAPPMANASKGTSTTATKEAEAARFAGRGNEKNIQEVVERAGRILDSNNIAVQEANKYAKQLGWTDEVVVLVGGPLKNEWPACVGTANGGRVMYIFENCVLNGYKQGNITLSGRALMAHEMGHEILTFFTHTLGIKVGEVDAFTKYHRQRSGYYKIEAEASRLASQMPNLTIAEQIALQKDVRYNEKVIDWFNSGGSAKDFPMP
jgi:hypothetical protein